MAENLAFQDLPELPRDSYKLIEWLDAAHPHKCIGRNESEKDAHRYAGMRDLVDELVEWMREEIEAERERSMDASDVGYSILQQDGVKRA